MKIMNKKPLFLSIAMAFSTPMIGTVHADILSLTPHPVVLKAANMPKRGETMKQVAKKFGSPQRVKTSSGKVTKRNPKITRWDYPGFSVYFENSHVIHSVIHQR